MATYFKPEYVSISLCYVLYALVSGSGSDYVANVVIVAIVAIVMASIRSNSGLNATSISHEMPNSPGICFCNMHHEAQESD